MIKSIERSHIPGRKVKPLAFTAEDCVDYLKLSDLGIHFGEKEIRQMAQALAQDYAQDDQQSGLTSPSITTPVQFLQNWLPGFIRVITAARKIDEIVGMTTVGSWEDEEIVQGILEYTGNAVPYGDYANVPLSSYNANFERRTVVRYEKGIKVGSLEEARAARIRVNAAAEKRGAAALALEIERNKTGFYGYNSGADRTYGYLNDPNLPNYGSLPNGASGFSTWAKKTTLEIIADIQAAAAALQTNSQDTINPRDIETTLTLPTAVVQYMATVTTLGYSVEQWVKNTYPKMRIVSAPQLNAANGGANVFYLQADQVEDGASDDSRVWVQVVPAKFQSLGVERQSKAYVEDYTNATAGVFLKRPYAVVRYTGC